MVLRICLFLSLSLLPIQEGKSQIDSTSYAVYGAYLNSLKSLSMAGSSDINTFFVFWKTKNLPSIGVRDTIKPNDRSGLKNNIFKRFYPDMDDETVLNFIVQIDEISILENRFIDTTLKVVVADDKIRNTLNKDDKNGYLYNELQNSNGALINFSNVGFNKLKNQALIYVERYVGPLSSSGDFIILEKEAGNWKVVKTILMWRS